MPSNLSGFPHCTKWKNYRYPLTRLDNNDSNQITIVEKTLQFNLSPLNIWISDDYFLTGDALDVNYDVVMTSATKDLITGIFRPRVFIDNTSGQSTSGQSTISSGERWAKLAEADNIQELDVTNSLASTISSTGNPQTLYTIIPGVHFGFISTSGTIYADTAHFEWQLLNTTLNGIPKIMDGTYTCWYQFPLTAGSTVVTEKFPSGIGNKSFNLMFNANRNIPKRSNTGANTGQTIYLEGSEDGVVWTTISELVDDIDVGQEEGHQFQVQWDSNALDGNDMTYKRLKFLFEASSSEIEFQPYSYVQINITPN